MGKIFQYNQVINTYDVLPDGSLYPTVPLDYFQESAQRQLEELGIGVEYLFGNHLGWILVKYEVDYFKYPKAGEEVIIETEPIGFNRFEALRRFSIKNKAGENLITGKSIWVLVDTETRKLLRVSEIEDLKALMDGDEGEIFKIPRLKKITDYDHKKEFDVRYSDIDINRHVNNVKYLTWALESLPLELVKKYEIEKLRILYKEQAFYGEKVVVKSKEIEPLLWRINVENTDGAVLSEIEILGRKRESEL